MQETHRLSHIADGWSVSGLPPTPFRSRHRFISLREREAGHERTSLGGRQIMLGCLDLDDPAVEIPETVAARVRRALAYVEPDDVILAPTAA